MSGTVIPVTVVAAFYSRSGATETRALTAAVGAVNARALIRMRRMPDLQAAGDAGDAAELRRMRKEYIPPAEADIVGAEALVVAVPPRVGVASPEWSPLVDMLSRLAGEGKLRGKVAGVVPGGDADDDTAFAKRLLALGFVVVPPDAGDTGARAERPLAYAQAHGRRVAEVARALKAASTRHL